MNTPRGLQEAEAWWAFAARVIAFVVGTVILLYETFSQGAEPYLIVAGVGMCGPVVAQSVATVFASIRGGGSDGQG